jgi:cyclic pyranopterin phosphate synthase
MTTNGTRLHEFAEVIKDAGITSLNISLDTLQRDRFLLMTKRDQFERVRRNIDMMVDLGFHIKVNVVVTKGVNDGEITDFIQWTKRDPIHVRFIEFMPFTGNRWQNDRVVTWQQILERAAASYDIIPLKRDTHDTAKSYTAPGHQGTFAVISTMSAPFCSDCNRMRLTADGKMKNCLFSQSETDLLNPLRHGEDIVPLIYQSIRDKKKSQGGQFTERFEELQAGLIENRSMITIGG